MPRPAFYPTKVIVVRFVRRKGAEPWLGILVPDTTGVAPTERLLLQKIPFIEDVRSFNFPSLTKVWRRRGKLDNLKKHTEFYFL